jgi:hypothetical protein
MARSTQVALSLALALGLVGVANAADPKARSSEPADRPAAGGPMGEDTTGKVGRDGPRGLPPGKAPGYEGADKGRDAEVRLGSQAEPKPPLGPPEDPVQRAR